MNKELKTLKDLGLQFEGTPQGEIAEKEYIKAEAIKHIKELENYNCLTGSNFPVTVSGHITNPKEIIAYIKWANNITEEDLK